MIGQVRKAALRRLGRLTMTVFARYDAARSSAPSA